MATIKAPQSVIDRLAEKQNDIEWNEMYRKWVNRSDTREVVADLKDLFCRPAPTATNNPMEALRAQAFQEGCWAVIDTLRALASGRASRPEPEIDYEAEEKKGGA